MTHAPTLSLVLLEQAFYELSIRCDSPTIGALSCACSSISTLKEGISKNQHWWYERVQRLTSSSLKHREGLRSFSLRTCEHREGLRSFSLRTCEQRKGNWAHVYKQLSAHGVQFSNKHDYRNHLLVLTLLDLGADPNKNNSILIRICEGHNHRALSLLLSDPILRVKDILGNVILHCCVNGTPECLKLLLKDERFNSSANKNNAFVHAIIEGNIPCAELLLTDPQVDPSYEDNRALEVAVEQGLVELCRTLVSDRRVRQKEAELAGGFWIGDAIKRKHYEIAALLLDLPETKPHSSWSLECAIVSGSCKMVKLVLRSTEEFTRADLKCINMSRLRRRQDMVELLLSVPQLRELEEERSRTEAELAYED